MSGTELALRIGALIGMFIVVYGGLFLFAWLPGRQKKREQKSKES